MLPSVAKAKTPSKSSSKPTKAPEGNGLTQINLRVPDELLAAIDSAVESINAADPWHRINRSDFIREAIVEALRKPRAAASKGSAE